MRFWSGIFQITRCSAEDDNILPGFNINLERCEGKWAAYGGISGTPVHCDGGVEVTDFGLEIYVYDRRDAVWVIQYENIRRVYAAPLNTRHLQAGMVEIIGTFDRNVEERVTMLITLDVFNDFVEAFNQRMDGAIHH